MTRARPVPGFEWHDLSRRLPPSKGYYFVQYEDGALRVRYFNAVRLRFKHSKDGNTHGRILYWMPFPEPMLEPQPEGPDAE